MKRLRPLIVACVTSCLLLLVLVPAALADEPAGGTGTYGSADDKVVTNAGFIVIAFFPTLILAAQPDPVAPRQAQSAAQGRGEAPRGLRPLDRRLVAGGACSRSRSP